MDNEFKRDFENIHCTNLDEAKYKIGDVVKFSHPNTHTSKGEITGVNDTGIGIEYSVDSIPVLLWEDEIKWKL